MLHAFLKVIRLNGMKDWLTFHQRIQNTLRLKKILPSKWSFGASNMPLRSPIEAEGINRKGPKQPSQVIYKRGDMPDWVALVQVPVSWVYHSCTRPAAGSGILLRVDGMVVRFVWVKATLWFDSPLESFTSTPSKISWWCGVDCAVNPRAVGIVHPPRSRRKWGCFESWKNYGYGYCVSIGSGRLSWRKTSIAQRCGTCQWAAHCAQWSTFCFMDKLGFNFERLIAKSFAKGYAD